MVLLKNCDMMDVINAIEVRNLCKQFDIKYTTFYGGQAKSGVKIVLNDLTFNVKKGKVLGIIGRNGSGKSTLLKILASIMYPNSGRIEVNGKVASILELGMGFEPEMTGRDNLVIKCKMYGLNDEEVKRNMEEIVEFSELGDQIDMPLRTYSSGMVAKLAFSVLIYVKCDILIIDEILSVGDASFNYKCKLIFEKMKKQNKTILFASHNLSTLTDLCDEVLWIDKGAVREIGDPLSVTHHFHVDSVDSPETLAILSAAGDISAINRLAILYRDGNGVQKDIEKSKLLFKKAASMGNTQSQVNLGDILAKEGKHEEAKEEYASAAEKGNLDAAIRLYSKNNDKGHLAVSRLKQLAESGNVSAMIQYSNILSEGISTSPDSFESINWLNKAALNYDIASMHALGIKYRDGNGIPKDVDKGLMWLSKSADLGYLPSIKELANMYRRGIGVEQNIEKCISFLENASRRGDGNSMIQLSTIYRDGIGKDKDPVSSEKWMMCFADRSRLNMEYSLANILNRAYLNEVDKQEAFKWYLDCAESGHVNAMYSVALMYRDGDGVQYNPDMAVEWFTKAVDCGHEGAMTELGKMYLKGIGVKQSVEKAIELLDTASLFGVSAARYTLATAYQYGTGVPRDLDKARYFYKLAAQQGNYNASVAFSKLIGCN